VRIIVTVTAGGGADITARLIGQWLSERLGQQFIVENRPGAGGSAVASRSSWSRCGWSRDKRRGDTLRHSPVQMRMRMQELKAMSDTIINKVESPAFANAVRGRKIRAAIA
jgi:hypothetical protein